MYTGEWLFTPDPPAPGTMQTGAAGYGAGYGAGMLQQSGTWSLIDPMTKELIIADPVKDARGNVLYDATSKAKKTVHDYWFKLQFKLEWKDAPKSAAPTGVVAPTPSRRSSGSSSSSSSSSGGGKRSGSRMMME